MKNFMSDLEKHQPSIGFGAYPVGSLITKTGYVTGIIYQGNNNFFVYDMLENGSTPFSAVGMFPVPLQVGRFYELSGVVEQRNGQRQLSVKAYKRVNPTDKVGALRILQGLPGLNMRAEELYNICGSSVVDDLCNNYKTVIEKAESHGFTKESILRWHSLLVYGIAEEESALMLLNIGLGINTARLLIEERGYKIRDEIKENPYILLQIKSARLSFAVCDKIAMDLGYELDGRDRIREAVLHTIEQYSAQSGCTCIPASDFSYALHNCLDVVIEREQAIHYINIAEGKPVLSEKVGGTTIDIDIEQLKAELSGWQESGDTELFQYVVFYCPDDKIVDIVVEMLKNGELVNFQLKNSGFYQTKEFFRMEDFIAVKLLKINQNNGDCISPVVIERLLEDVLREQGSEENPIQLEARQREAVITACSRRGGVFIITGAAGSGKTFVLNIILSVLDKYMKKTTGSPVTSKVLAPTGKAAKIASLATGLQGSTIHRFVAATKMRRTETSSVYVIDEFSMVDEQLFMDFLEQMPTMSKLILLGDTNQLPSIEVGNCLHDLIDSGIIPCTTLNVVKRQSSKSGILLMANHICRGEDIKSEIVNTDGNNDNAIVSISEDEVSIRRKIVKSAERLGLGAFREERVQILCPRNRGNTGAEVLNHIIQQKLNPYQPALGQLRLETGCIVSYRDDNGNYVKEPMYFQIGDRVIHTRNNYNAGWYTKDLLGGFTQTMDHGVMNGEVGEIEDIRDVPVQGVGIVRRVIVRYDGKYIFYDGKDIEDLMHAYAITIHRSQGSQWPIVLCPITNSDSRLLTRQLLYTACTRAQKTLFIVAQKAALATGVETEAINHRVTRLQERLQNR